MTKNNDRNVVSLRRIFDDIRAHTMLITREIFVCYDGIIYDYNQILSPSSGFGGDLTNTGRQRGGCRDWSTPHELHQAFDKLCSKSPNTRTRDDKIDPAIFDRIENLFAQPAILRLQKLRDKVIAHAADPAARVSVENFGFTLDEAAKALENLCKIQRLIQVDLLWNSHSDVMPTPQYDIMKHMDQPLLREHQIRALGPFWSKLVSEREGWSVS